MIAQLWVYIQLNICVKSSLLGIILQNSSFRAEHVAEQLLMTAINNWIE